MVDSTGSVAVGAGRGVPDDGKPQTPELQRSEVICDPRRSRTAQGRLDEACSRAIVASGAARTSSRATQLMESIISVGGGRALRLLLVQLVSFLQLVAGGDDHRRR